MKEITRTIKTTGISVKVYYKEEKEIKDCYYFLYGSEKDYNEKDEIKKELDNYFNDENHIVVDFEIDTISYQKCSLSVEDFYMHSKHETVEA